MEIFNKILHSYAIYCRKKMVKIFKCYLIPRKSYDTLSKVAIFFGQPCSFALNPSQGFVLTFNRMVSLRYAWTQITKGLFIRLAFTDRRICKLMFENDYYFKQLNQSTYH